MRKRGKGGKREVEKKREIGGKKEAERKRQRERGRWKKEKG